MPTYDWIGTDIIPNGSGSAVRADLNDAMLALFSQNSSATEPPEAVAYMPWADTANGLYKIRNAANSGWITLYQLDGEWTSIALENGTAAAPSLYFKDSGTDTGIFSPGADQFGIATNGVERVEFGNTEVVFNDGGADVDFRVEGDTKPNLFKVDAGADTVIIDGLTHPSADGSAGQSLVTNGSGVLSVASVPPPGSIFWFAANAAPAGYLKANGANVNRTTYAALFAAIGTTFGVGDGSTTFTLPDLRGEFARGWDDGRGIDSGRTFGSAQGHAFASHTHTYTASGASGNSVTGGPTPIYDGGQTLNTGAQGAAAETRPRNIALLAIIKF
jgi:microcystin-dependent protein